MKKVLSLSLLLAVIGSASAEMKTLNELQNIDIKELPGGLNGGAAAAVRSHGRIHEVVFALQKALDAHKNNDCVLAEKITKCAFDLANRASKLSAGSAMIKIETERKKQELINDHVKTKRAKYPRPKCAPNYLRKE